MSSKVTKKDLDKEAEIKFRPSLFFKRQTKSENSFESQAFRQGRTKGRVKKFDWNTQHRPKL
jgi:hypothetical protein